MPIDYNLTLRKGQELDGIVGPINKLDRKPIYRSRISVESSFVSRFDPIFDMSHADSASLDFEQCSAKMAWNGSRSDGGVAPRRKLWRSFMEGYTPEAYSDLSLGAVAALSQFHTLTTAQIAAFMGVSFEEAHNALTRLYGCGVLLRANGGVVDHDETISKLGHVWRIASGRGSGPFVERWLNNLTDFEYTMVTSGRDISRFVDTSRHYIRGNVSDASVVTSSGRVILFEVTTAKMAGDTISQKAMAWAFAIATSDIDFAVVFANTNPEHDRSLYRYRVLSGILDAEDKLTNPGPSLRKAQSRIFVSDVTNHWCPTSHVVTGSMSTMDVLNPATLAYYRLAPEGVGVVSTPSVISSRAALSTPAWITNDIKDL